MEDGQIKISVIVPVYNVEKYIRTCLDSIVEQTYKKLEIILVDDGSTDSSGEICDEYAAKDSRIAVIHKANGGVSSARKAGIKLATGEYAAYVDSDDWIEKNTYEELAKSLVLYCPDILAFGFVKEYPQFGVKKKEVLGKGFYSRESFFREAEKCIENTPFFCKAIDISVWSKVFKTHLLKKYMLEVDDGTYIGEDLAAVFPIMFEMDSIYIEDGIFYHYRVNMQSACWKKRGDEYGRYLRLIRYISGIRSQLKEWNNKLEKYFVQIIYWYLSWHATGHCLVENSKFILYPELASNDKIVVYGKGVFANNLVRVMRETGFCSIVDCIDRVDAERIRQIPEKLYKYIAVAITDYSAVRSSISILEKLGIDMSKVIYIQKENLTVENLPSEIRELI